MTLGGEVGDGVDLMFAQQAVDQRPVADVALDEKMPGGIGQVAQVVQRTGVGQQVEIDNANLRISGQQMADKVAANEAGAAGHEYVMRMMFHDQVSKVRGNAEFGNDRRMIRRALQAARGRVDPASGANRSQRWTDEKMVDAQAHIATEGGGPVIPLGETAFCLGKQAEGVF